MVTIQIRDGIEYSYTTVLLRSDLRDKAKRAQIPFSRTLSDALEKRIEDLEREGGKPDPTPGHHPRETEADSC